MLACLLFDKSNAQDYSCLRPPRTCDREVFFEPVVLEEYYAKAVGIKHDAQALREELHGLLVENHRNYSYACVWNFMMEADEDPNNPDNIIAFYTRRSIPKAERDCGCDTRAGQANPNAWNREHTWPKSHGFKNSVQHAHTDFHHLVPADKQANANRGDKDFKSGGSPDDECTECRVTGKTWEPSDASKGAVARMIFYMDVRYEGVEPGDGGTPDLVLVDGQTNAREPKLGHLSELLKWHCEHPVTEEERRRNDAVYSWQGNRNPFIDHPEFFEVIWGHKCSTNRETELKEQTGLANRSFVSSLIDKIKSIRQVQSSEL